MSTFAKKKEFFPQSLLLSWLFSRRPFLPFCLLLGSGCLLKVWGQQVEGTITEAATGRPLANVNLVLVGTSSLTVSDQAGKFRLTLPSSDLRHGRYTLRASAIGYDSFEQTLSPEQIGVSALVIPMKQAVIELHQLVVETAQRQESSPFGSPESISVRSPTRLEQDAPRTAPEALTGTTGVWLQKTNHGGGSPFLRGLTGQQTLLMIDGIRLNNATFRSGHNQYLHLIDPQTIRQIEVLRGSGSVQYGSDALGGVVNVLTRDPDFSAGGWRVGGNVYAKYMSADMEKSGRAEIGLSTPRLALSGGFAYRDFGDLLAGGKLGFERPTAYRQQSGDLKARVRVAGNHLLTLAYQRVSQADVPLYHKVKLENFTYNRFDPQDRQLSYARWESFYAGKWVRKAQLTLLSQQWKEGRQSQKNGSDLRVEELDQVATWGAILTLSSQPTEYWSISSGIDYYDDRVRSTREEIQTQKGTITSKRGLYPDGARYTSLAAYSLHTLQLNRWTLGASGRWNTYRISVQENTLGESTLTPSALVGSLSASYALHEHHRLVASVNTAFRAPNVDDLGTLGIVDFRYEVPNPDLKPEKSLNVELGWQVKSQGVSGSLSVYQNFLTDMITRVRQENDMIAGYPVYLKRNTARAFIRGLEAEAEISLSTAVVAYANVTYTYGQNTSADEPFRRIPPLNGLLGLRYQKAQGFWARGEWLAAARQNRLAKGDKEDNRISPQGTPAWSVLNLSAGFRTSGWILGASIQNVFDIPYRYHGSGVDGYGRSFTLSGKFCF